MPAFIYPHFSHILNKILKNKISEETHFVADLSLIRLKKERKFKNDTDEETSDF